MQTSIFRLSVRSMMLWVAGSALLLGFLTTYTSRRGCGHTPAIVSFCVVDDHDGKPIAGARIEVPEGKPIVAKTITASDGSAEVTCEVSFTVYERPFFSTYSILHFSEGIQIERPGYEHKEEYVQLGWKHEGDGLDVSPRIVLRLKRSQESLSNEPSGSGGNSDSLPSALIQTPDFSNETRK